MGFHFVGQGLQRVGLGIVLAALGAPPFLDAVDGERRGVGGLADEDGADVSPRVVDAVGDGEALGIGAEVVVLDLFGTAVPFHFAGTIFLLNSTRMHDLVSGYANGTTVNLLPIDAVERPLIPVPPRALVDAFDAITSCFGHRREQSERESRTLTVLRDKLLPKLVSGELSALYGEDGDRRSRQGVTGAKLLT